LGLPQAPLTRALSRSVDKDLNTKGFEIRHRHFHMEALKTSLQLLFWQIQGYSDSKSTKWNKTKGKVAVFAFLKVSSLS